MKDIKAEELLRRHLDKKNLTNEHIHIAAFMSCIDAINEALNLPVVGSQRELLISFAKYWNEKDYGYVKIDDTESEDPNDIDLFLQQ